MLNIFLVLGAHTTMKSNTFIAMVDFHPMQMKVTTKGKSGQTCAPDEFLRLFGSKIELQLHYRLVRNALVAVHAATTNCLFVTLPKLL